MGQRALLAQVLTHFSFFSVFFGFGDAQSNFLYSQSTRKDLYFNFLAQFQNIFRFFNALFSDFGDVDHAFVFFVQFNDCAEGQEPYHFTGYNINFDVFWQTSQVFLQSF